MHFVDAMMGDLVARLVALDLYEETIVVVTSDHGEGFYEHGEIQHGYAPFEELLRIPLVIRLPANHHAGTQVEAPVSLVDLLPTLVELAGLSRPEAVAGRSLTPLLRSEGWAPRMHFAEGVDSVAVRSSTLKLIATAESFDFYDLVADPRELQPLSRRECGERCAGLEAALETYRGSAPGSAPDAVPLTTGEIEDMRTLGYL